MTDPADNTPPKHVHALRADDYTLGDGALDLDGLQTLVHELREVAPRAFQDAFARLKRQRRTGVKTVIREAKEAGASSVTTRDGDHVAFGEPSASSKPNPWDELFDEPNQKRPS